MVWFFVGEPKSFQLGRNNLKEQPNKIMRIRFEDLDSEKILYRAGDNVVGYMGEFEGKTEDYTLANRYVYIMCRYIVYLQLIVYLGATIFVLITLFGLDLGMKIAFILFFVVPIIIIVLNWIKKLISKFKVKNS
ncbi:hypothetical protein [Psychrobacillus sp. FSL K6-1267]|uniref:hypothetical protein n=1 Tax=Psychrobacillus sp. FSL K6-1267 TaxID=2921543 RepID=UPI0030F7DCBE